MRQFEEVIDVLDGRAGMYTMHSTFGEVCAFFDGFDACSELKTMQAFRHWLARRGNGGAELTWWGLVLAEMGEGFRVADTREFSATQNEQAISLLFSLVREFIRDCPE